MIRKIDRMCKQCGLSDPAIETEELWGSRSSSENMHIAIKATGGRVPEAEDTVQRARARRDSATRAWEAV